MLEGGLGPTAKALWTFGFDKLKGSADDGQRLLYLDFGSDDGEIVSILQRRPLCRRNAKFKYL